MPARWRGIPIAWAKRVHGGVSFARLGELEIPVQEINDDDLHAELAMIDENLCRAELSPADKARQTARRKVIYEALHPDTRHGSPGVSRQVGDTRERTDTDRFTADTAARTGQSERTVQRNVERGEKVIDEVVDLVRGTRLDNGSYLDKIKVLSPNDQVTAVRRDLVGGSAHLQDAPKRLGPATGIITRPASQVTQPAGVYSDFIALVDQVAALPAADVIAACPPRERAALCSRLSHLTDLFHQIMEGVAS